MSHSTRVIGYKALSNGQFAVLLRCCDDPRSDHWHTMSTGLSKKQRVSSIDAAREIVARQHADALDAENHAIELMGEEKQHS